MNPMHQLTRRPVKAAFGALLLALAGVILALSGGQFWAAARTRAGVEATYTTVAVVTAGTSRRGTPTHPSQVPPPHGKRPGFWRSRNSRTGASSGPGPGWAWSAAMRPI